MVIVRSCEMADSEMDDLSQKIQTVLLNHDADHEVAMFEEENTELPSVLIATNVHVTVYEDDSVKAQFEEAFKEWDPACDFQYLKSFRRARVQYNDPITAAKARIHMHGAEICGSYIKCYFAQPAETMRDGDSHLLPPAPMRQFLISPPSSPPVGWEPCPEAEPVINYDLISAIASLTPGESHELHPPSETQPGIVVHICEDLEGMQNRPLIPKTRRPNQPT